MEDFILDIEGHKLETTSNAVHALLGEGEPALLAISFLSHNKLRLLMHTYLMTPANSTYFCATEVMTWNILKH